MATKLNSLLESPGVSINERDLSTVTTNVIGTNVYIPGFAAQGPTDEPLRISTLSEFEEIFGLPTTAAEKYTHNAVKQLLTTSNAAVTFTRMPYGSGAGYGFAETYNALVFPIVGLSATEKSVCDFYQNLTQSEVEELYPWLSQNFVPQSVCYGSSNLSCPLSSGDEDPGFLYIHDHPFQYDSVLTEFKFTTDSDPTHEDLVLIQLRPRPGSVDGNYNYDVVNRYNLSALRANLDENGSESVLTVSFESSAYGQVFPITSGILSGISVTGVPVSAGDVFGTYSLAGSPVLKFYNASTSVASTYKTSYTQLSSFNNTAYGLVSSVSLPVTHPSYAETSAWFANYCTSNAYRTVSCNTAINTVTSVSGASVTTFSVSAAFRGLVSAPVSGVESTTQDFLITFCAIPLEAGLTCSTISALGLTVPEESRYSFSPLLGDATLNDANFYAIGEPISKALNSGEYQLLKNSQFNWKCGVFDNAIANLDVANNDIRGGIVVVNKLKTAQMEDFTGYYLTLNDNLNVNPSTDYDDLTGVAGYYNELCPGVSGEWVTVPQDRLNFEVSATFDGVAGSITEIVHQNVGLEFGKADYVDSLILSLFKISPSRATSTINKLDQTRIEQFVGSLNSERKVHDDFGGPDRSFFLEKTVNNGSNYLEVFVNPYLSQNNCWTNQDSGKPQKTVRMFRKKTGGIFDSGFSAEQTLKGYGDKLYGSGSYSGYCRDAAYDLCIKKDIGNLPAKLERALRGVENPIDYPIDITIDNGLSTIWATRSAVVSDRCITDPSICYNYDDTYYVNTDSLSPYDGTVMNSALQDNWEVIFNIFDSFARYTRKAVGGVPHLHIQDPLRQIFVNGKDYKIIQRQKQLFIDPATNQPSEKYASFGRNIYSYLRNLYQGINSSYSVSYANWFKSYDSNSDSFTWYGPSSFQAALLARNDFNQYPWTAPLGVSNGQLGNINDLAINPNQRERDLISRIGLNPVVRFPEGNLNWNSTTLLKESSALKEISIRRGALWLAKSIQGNLVQFIGQPNTITTRTRINNTLKPILDYMKDNAGLYDYLIICDERNNTPASIDQGVLNVAVYIKPTRPVKFILVDLVITGTGVNFSELI